MKRTLRPHPEAVALQPPSMPVKTHHARWRRGEVLKFQNTPRRRARGRGHSEDVAAQQHGKCLKFRHMHTAPALTHKQLRFVDEYLVDGNGTRAALAAGYGRAAAHASASRTLRIVKVQEGLQARQSVDAAPLIYSA